MHKPLSYAALLLVSQFPLQALADTDVYLTNNGPEPLQLAISQSGSGQLQAGSCRRAANGSSTERSWAPGRAPWCSASIATRG